MTDLHHVATSHINSFYFVLLLNKHRLDIWPGSEKHMGTLWLPTLADKQLYLSSSADFEFLQASICRTDWMLLFMQIKRATVTKHCTHVIRRSTEQMWHMKTRCIPCSGVTH